jgi:ankyrin repeat protein
MSLYKNKYLKYKSKYLKLKTQIGGSSLDELNEKITYTENHCIGKGDYFHQHVGECWNDSIQMLICFSDELKAQVQVKLFNLTPKEIIDMAYLNSRGKFLVPINRRSKSDITNSIISIKFEKRLEKYLMFLQKRLCSHITNSNPTKIIPKCDRVELECETEETLRKYNKYLVSGHYYEVDEIYAVIDTLPTELIDDFRERIIGLTIDKALQLLKDYLPQQDPKIKLRRQKSELVSIGSAINGIKIANAIATIESHGATIEIQTVLLNYLSFCLLDNSDVIKTNYIKNMSDLNQTYIQESFGILVHTPNHVTCFYICNDLPIYYNDNHGKILCNWKTLLQVFYNYKDTHNLVLHFTYEKFTILFINNTNNECLLVDKDIKITVSDINLYGNWKQYMVKGLQFIKKVNLKNTSDAIVYDTLEDQFIIGELLNDSLPVIKNTLNITNYLCDIDIKLVCKILLTLNTTLDKSVAQDLLYKMTFYLSTEDNIRIFKLLICSGADVNYNKHSALSILALCVVGIESIANNKIIELLVDSGANINELFPSLNKTILELALDNNKLNTARLLIKLGANVNITNDKGETLILQYLHNMIKDNDSDEEIDDSDEEIDDSDEEEKNKLLNDEIIKLLIRSGIDLSIKDSNGKTAFELAIENMKYDIVKLLIESGADINQEFSTGETALFYLIEQIQSGTGKTDYLDYVKLLIKSGVDLEQIGNSELTPLQHIIANSKTGNADEYTLVKILLDAGADYTVESEILGFLIEFIKDSDDKTMKKIFESHIKQTNSY